MNDMSPEATDVGVIAEVEVVVLTFGHRRGLNVSGVGAAERGGRRQIPRARMRSGESPSDTAVRVLVEHGLTAALHEPEFVRFDTHADRQLGQPTLTLTFMVISHAADVEPIRGVWPVLVDEERALIDHITSVDAARQAAVSVLGRLPLATALAPRKGAAFTLTDLIAVYAAFAGPTVPIDRANFRRRALSIPGFIEPTEPPDWFAPDERGRGRPESWYLPGSATTLDPAMWVR